VDKCFFCFLVSLSLSHYETTTGRTDGRTGWTNGQQWKLKNSSLNCTHDQHKTWHDVLSFSVFVSFVLGASLNENRKMFQYFFLKKKKVQKNVGILYFF
jgi:hypothetical protein